MVTKHTPGPWEISNDAVPDYHIQVSIYSGNDRVAMVFISEANAALIAAAPDLLAAAVAALACHPIASKHPATDVREVAETLRAAIAKATKGE